MLLLAWLAYDSDDACVAAGNRYFDRNHLDGYPAMAALRALHPMLYRAVSPSLDHPNAAVCDTALAAALAIAEHPRPSPTPRRPRPPSPSAPPHQRHPVAPPAGPRRLRAWEHDTTALASPGNDDRNPCTRDCFLDVNPPPRPSDSPGSAAATCPSPARTASSTPGVPPHHAPNPRGLAVRERGWWRTGRSRARCPPRTAPTPPPHPRQPGWAARVRWAGGTGRARGVRCRIGQRCVGPWRVVLGGREGAGEGRGARLVGVHHSSASLCASHSPRPV